MNRAVDKYRVYDEEKKEYVSSRVFINHHGETCVIRHGGFYPHKVTKEHCTGLKDKNGKLIYENDVVNMYIHYEDAYRKCVVQYCIDEGTAQWLAVYLEGKRHHCSMNIQYDITAEYLDGSCCTVIGNIHDDQFRDATKMVEG